MSRGKPRERRGVYTKGRIENLLRTFKLGIIKASSTRRPLAARLSECCGPPSVGAENNVWIRVRQFPVWPEDLFRIVDDDAFDLACTAFADDRVFPNVKAVGPLAVEPELLKALLDAVPRRGHDVPEIPEDARAHEQHAFTYPVYAGVDGVDGKRAACEPRLEPGQEDLAQVYRRGRGLAGYNGRRRGRSG
jgi:hypothetical protein